jgi:hypothetical protein
MLDGGGKRPLEAGEESALKHAASSGASLLKILVPASMAGAI